MRLGAVYHGICNVVPCIELGQLQHLAQPRALPGDARQDLIEARVPSRMTPAQKSIYELDVSTSNLLLSPVGAFDHDEYALAKGIEQSQNNLADAHRFLDGCASLVEDVGGRSVHNPLAHTCDSDVELATSGCDVVGVQRRGTGDDAGHELAKDVGSDGLADQRLVFSHQGIAVDTEKIGDCLRKVAQ